MKYSSALHHHIISQVHRGPFMGPRRQEGQQSKVGLLPDSNSNEESRTILVCSSASSFTRGSGLSSGGEWWFQRDERLCWRRHSERTGASWDRLLSASVKQLINLSIFLPFLRNAGKREALPDSKLGLRRLLVLCYAETG